MYFDIIYCEDGRLRQWIILLLLYYDGVIITVAIGTRWRLRRRRDVNMVGKASDGSVAPKWGRRRRRRRVACADKTVVGAPSVRVRLSLAPQSVITAVKGRTVFAVVNALPVDRRRRLINASSARAKSEKPDAAVGQSYAGNRSAEFNAAPRRLLCTYTY